MTWTPELVDRMCEGWSQGQSAGQLADGLGKTRNAVLGKLFRLGLLKRKFPGIRIGHSKASYAKARPEAPWQPSGERAAPAPKMAKEPLPKEDPIPDVVISHDDLEEHHCRWIYGAVGSQKWGFCGQERVGALPYCQSHAKRAYTANYEALDARDRAKQNWKIAKAKKEAGETVG